MNPDFLKESILQQKEVFEKPKLVKKYQVESSDFPLLAPNLLNASHTDTNSPVKSPIRSRRVQKSLETLQPVSHHATKLASPISHLDN